MTGTLVTEVKLTRSPSLGPGLGNCTLVPQHNSGVNRLNFVTFSASWFDDSHRVSQDPLPVSFVHPVSATRDLEVGEVSQDLPR